MQVQCVQALLDWLLLGQTPSAVEIVGLIVALGGAIFMAIGDDYIIAPLSRDNKNKLPKDVHVDMEVGCSGEYKSPEIKSDSAAKKTQNFNDKKKFLEGEMSKPVNSNGKMSDTNIDSKIPNGNSVPSAPTNPQVENPKQEELHAWFVLAPLNL